MPCIVVEPILFSFFVLVFIAIVLSRLSATRRAALVSLGTGMICSIILEIVNERIFAGRGTVYQCTLARFFPFHFPIAIVCFGGAYALVIATFAWFIACHFFPGRGRRATNWLYAVLVALFTVSALGCENAGVALGYWRHLRATDISLIYQYIYCFYAAFTLPAAAAFRIAHASTKR
jgi:hypothetical protein